MAWYDTFRFLLDYTDVLYRFTTIYGEFSLLTGKSAPHEFIQLVIYKAMTYSEDIVGIDTVRAYHVNILSFLLVLFLTSKVERTVLLRGSRYRHGPKHTVEASTRC